MSTHDAVGGQREVSLGSLPTTVVNIGLLTFGVSMLWWANEQLTALRLIGGSTFQIQSWRTLFWSLTLVGAGVLIGLIVTRDASVRASWGVIAVALGVVGLLLAWPLLGLFLAWSPIVLPFGLSLFLFTQMGTFSLVAGFLIAGLIGPSQFGSSAETV